MLLPSEIFYEGKNKTLHTTSDPAFMILEFRDVITAEHGARHAPIEGKGRVNHAINAHIMRYLQEQGIPTHFVEAASENSCVVKTLKMIPIELVVRNYASGFLSRRLDVAEGFALEPSVVEFYLKSDKLKDPWVNEDHIHTFGFAKDHEVWEMRKNALRINDWLKVLFLQAGLLLVDYKLEWGLSSEGVLCLGDEWTPDTARIWDAGTLKRLDRDRYVQDLGHVLEGYQEVAQRLGIL